MSYDLDSPQRGVTDCPRCQHTMTFLRSYNAVRRNEGYLLDDGTDRNWLTFLLWGWEGLLLKLFYRNVVEPLTARFLGDRRQQRLDRILQEYPHSLICPHCNHILKRK